MITLYMKYLENEYSKETESRLEVTRDHEKEEGGIIA